MLYIVNLHFRSESAKIALTSFRGGIAFFDESVAPKTATTEDNATKRFSDRRLKVREIVETIGILKTHVGYT